MGVAVVRHRRDGDAWSVSPSQRWSPSCLISLSSSSTLLLAFAMLTIVPMVTTTGDDGSFVAKPMTEDETSSSSDVKLRLPTFIASNMVLQREPAAAVLWGWATPGSEVAVELVREGDNVRRDGKSEERQGKSWGRNLLRRVTRAGRSEVENVVDGTLRGTARGQIPSGVSPPRDGAFIARATAAADEVTGAFNLSLPPRPAGFGFALRFYARLKKTQPTSPPSSQSPSSPSPSSPATPTLTLHNVAFGEVWLCSGQSNMQFTVAGSFNATEEILDSANYPRLRLATVKLTSSSAPQPDVAAATTPSPPYDAGAWAVSSPQAFNPAAPGDPSQPYGGDGGFGWFSATCYFFGRQLYRHFGGRVPVGLVDSDWGGQKVECFSSPDALDDDTCGGTRTKKGKPEAEKKQKKRKRKRKEEEEKGGEGEKIEEEEEVEEKREVEEKKKEEVEETEVEEEGRGHEVANEEKEEEDEEEVRTSPQSSVRAADRESSYAFRRGGGGDDERRQENDFRPDQDGPPTASSLWNGMIYPLLRMRFAGVAWYQGEANFMDPPEYACRFPAMIADWRMKMRSPDLAFVFVQLAAYPKRDYSEVRNAQMSAAGLPGVGYAVAADLGDPASPWDCVHPRRKQEVGRRLALAAIRLRYDGRGADESYDDDKDDNEDDAILASTSTSGLRARTNDVVLAPSSVPTVHFRGPVFEPEKPEVIMEGYKYEKAERGRIAAAGGGVKAGGGGGGGVVARVKLRMRLKPASEGGAAPGTLHAHPTADCALTGSTRCCDEPPFEVRLQSSSPRVVSTPSFDPPAVGAMPSGGRLSVLTAATLANAREACGLTPACVGFTFEWNMVSAASIVDAEVDAAGGAGDGGGDSGAGRDQGRLGRGGTLSHGPPAEDTVFPSVYLQRAAPEGVSAEWDVNASWTSCVRSDWSDGDGWVRADNFTVKPLHDGGDETDARTKGGGGGAVVVEVAVSVRIPGRVHSVDSVTVRVTGVRYAWERYPQCSLYDGAGSWDHREDAIAATPFCFDVASDALCLPTRIPDDIQG